MPSQLPMEPPPGIRRPTDAILTVPNLLTFFRLALIPVFLWLAIGPKNIAAALAVALVGFGTDLIDGRIARRFGQISRLGILLDPLADRLALAAGGVIFIVDKLAPVWAVVVVLGRDALLVLIGAPILRARQISIPPVSRLGKNASFAVSMSFALFLASGVPGVMHPSSGLRIAAWVFFALGVPAYYLTALGYARAGLEGLRKGEPSSHE
ncbi:MAG: CDP-alcohol phosphatidyltransferase family protein [Actinomycetota bacterium]|nr:CDP-alcohol phosphatidyltransferase family protein [Actinomycetota bacterium]